MMQSSYARIIVDLYCRTHQRLLTLAEKATETQLHWRPTPQSHSMAFHLWHVARWADYMRAAIPGMTPELQQQLGAPVQIWESEGLAARWNFDFAELGYSQTGMSMSDDVARDLNFPDKAELVAYVSKAFAAVEQIVRSIDDHQFEQEEQPQPLTEGIWGEGTVGNAILEHVVHNNRHLGAMESLYGLQTGSGTASI
jgi:hypothetical protein